MESFAIFMGLLWAALSVTAQILSLMLIAALIFSKLRNKSFVLFFENKALLIAFIVSLLATLGSLIYSDIIGYQPCKLCWFQRIFMYPQVILMGVALIRKDVGMKIYGCILSVIGAAIALYHYLGQFDFTSLPCSALGQSVSCSTRFSSEFGYITIPLMAFSAFVLMALSLWISIQKDRVSNSVITTQ